MIEDISEKADKSTATTGKALYKVALRRLKTVREGGLRKGSSRSRSEFIRQTASFINHYSSIISWSNRHDF